MHGATESKPRETGPEQQDDRAPAQEDLLLYQEVHALVVQGDALLAVMRQAERKEIYNRSTESKLLAVLGRARTAIEGYGNKGVTTSYLVEQAVSEYMQLVSNMEETILNLEVQENTGKKGGVAVTDWKDTFQSYTALSAINHQTGLRVPEWMVLELGSFATKESTLKKAKDEETLDETYEGVILLNPPGRTGALSYTAQALILRAALSLPRADAEGDALFCENLNRARNAVEWIEADWRKRENEPVAEKYALWGAQLERAIRAVAQLHGRAAVPEQVDAIVGVGETEHHLERPDASRRELTTALHRRFAQIEYLVPNIHSRADDIQAREQLIERLLHVYQQAQVVVDRLLRNGSDTESFFADDMETELLERLSRIESVINSVDTGSAAIRESNAELDEYELRPENAWAVDVVAGVEKARELKLHPYVRALIADIYDDPTLAFNDHEIEGEIAELYEDAMIESEGTPARSRASLQAIVRDLLAKAGRVEHPLQDQDGDIHRARLAIAELADLWSKRFPPIAQKYTLLLDSFDNMIQVLRALTDDQE